jgi:predicted AAA+ superfamily ATPase
MLDGSISAAPDNVLLCATSNRRHLLPEYLTGKSRTTRIVDGELHHGEAVEEKISLSERFGLWLSFHPVQPGRLSGHRRSLAGAVGMV